VQDRPFHASFKADIAIPQAFLQVARMNENLQAESDAVFSTAAELFGLLSTPIRLRILSSLCHGEKNVTQLLAEIDTTQPNMSQHLSTLYRAGVLGKRRDATQIYYRIENQQAVAVCRSVCTQIALDMAESDEQTA
jgi:ArsR family transcriptional regulator